MDELEAIKVTFFQECEELLADLEGGLLAMQEGVGDIETVNAVFRAVHSIKGGAGAFGLEPLVRFAHVFETLLDAVRSNEVPSTVDLAAVMLRASDVLADHVSAARGLGDVDMAASAAMAAELKAWTDPSPRRLRSRRLPKSSRPSTPRRRRLRLSSRTTWTRTTSASTSSR
jgi:two-component system chemotaxis sensor kinase CheA